MSADAKYFNLDNTPESRVEIKKSLFIARAKHVNNRNEAIAFVGSLKDEFTDARHHCWAYSLGDPKQPSSAAMSDDGEPSGTAGKPILNVIQHKEVGNLIIVVIRYFGGIKLGAGGLVRAYSQAASKLYESMELLEHQDLIELQISCEFKDEQWVRRKIAAYYGQVIDCEFGETVQMTLLIPSNVKEQVATDLKLVTSILSI